MEERIDQFSRTILETLVDDKNSLVTISTYIHPMHTLHTFVFSIFKVDKMEKNNKIFFVHFQF